MNAFNDKRHSIKRKISAMMLGSLLLILVGALFVSWSTFNTVSKYERVTQKLSLSQEYITDLSNETNEIILRVRGYFAYLDSYEYEQIFKAKEGLDKAVASIKETSVNGDELELVERVHDYFEDYLKNVLPKGAAFAEKGDYTSLRKLITLGVNNPVNETIQYAHQSEKLIQQHLKDEREDLLRTLVLQGIYFIIYIVLILVVSALITRRLAKDIGNPLSRLSQYALNYGKGETIQAELLSRRDEIGMLSRSLERMTYEIQEKEEELLAQNEELHAQQDELEAQQAELQRAIVIMEQNELFLNKRNSLIQSLANTLNRKELLDSVIRNVVEISRTDKGMIVLMNESMDYSAHGLSEEEVAQCLEGFGQSAAVRAVQSKRVFIRERDATTGEKGYVADLASAYDIFIPLLKGDDEVAACMMLTRIGKAIDTKDETEIYGLVGQISLSLEKLEMFETIENQRQMTRDMLNTIQEGVQLMNLGGQSLRVNEKLYELLGLSYESAELNGIGLPSLKALLSERIDEPEALFDCWDRALGSDSEQARSMIYVINKPEHRTIQMYWEPIYRKQQQFGILLVHRDVTKEFEVDRMKSEFVSTVSHELRTPLASILGFSELMLHRELKPERQRKYMETIYREAQRLTSLVNDFLDLQRMENGMQFYHIGEVDLALLLEEVVEIQQAGTAKHRLIRSIPREKMTVLGDKDKLFQLFVNLVNNAIKYSPEGGAITIEARREGDSYRIRIEDEGLGIPEQAIPNLFAKFYRVDNSDRREIGGTGLGLAIVKEIANRHKGDVSVQSRLGEGSTFTIELPVHESSIVGVGDRNDSGNQSEEIVPTPQVMLVENDHSLSVMLHDHLTEKGYTTSVFSDGESVIRALEAGRPDIVILDLKLSTDMSGWEVIERMKASEALVNVPIVISSAFEEQGKALQWGISHFLTKPYDPDKLIETIESIIQSKSAVPILTSSGENAIER
ncbi:ATP-binding protein [Cohnella soli]|uniref:histidine kinase n=1 Tax=Cohnella soli TaxID=425005 RepID=A0ABW0HLQ4_9BACL